MMLLLPASVAVAMFGSGLRLPRQALGKAAVLPLGVLLFATIIGAPVVALLLGSLFGGDTTMTVALLVIACCPVGVTASVWCGLARGSVLHTIVATILSTALAPISISLWLSLLPGGLSVSEAALAASLGQMVLTIGALTGLPLFLGIWINRRRPVSTAIGEWCKTIGALGVLASFALVIWDQRAAMAMAAGFLPAIVALNATMAVIGLIIGIALRGTSAVRRAMMFGVVTRQEETGLLVATTMLGMPLLAVPLLANAVIATAMALCLIALFRVVGAPAPQINPEESHDPQPA